MEPSWECRRFKDLRWRRRIIGGFLRALGARIRYCWETCFIADCGDAVLGGVGVVTLMEGCGQRLLYILADRRDVEKTPKNEKNPRGKSYVWNGREKKWLEYKTMFKGIAPKDNLLYIYLYVLG